MHATLVRPVDDVVHPVSVLYVHGWNDYFFQSHLAEGLAARGVSLWALDLRRYGRSLRPGQLCGWIADVGEYAEEILAAVAAMRQAGHRRVALLGHSTGGLSSAIVAAEHPGAVDGLALNAPWLVQATTVLRALFPVMAQWGRLEPRAVLREQAPGVYGRSLHVDWGGEWDYLRDWKSSPHFKVRMGWARAIERAQHQAASGLGLALPVACFTAARSGRDSGWGPHVFAADTVLDVEAVRQVALGLGPRVTSVTIEDGMHDLALSRLPARETYMDRLADWLVAEVA